MVGSLILDTKMKGDAASVRQTADWLIRYARAVHDAATATRNVRVNSLNVWDGPAANAMREDVSDLTSSGDVLAGHVDEFHKGLFAFADALDKVRSKLDDARGKATAVGLKVTPGEIYPPAPVPPAPPMGGASTPQSPADAQRMAAEHSSAMGEYQADVAANNRQTPVYNECKNIVFDARNIEKTVHEDLKRLSTGIDAWIKDLKKIGFLAISGGLDAIKGSQETATDLRRLAIEWSDSSEVFDKVANGKYLTDADKTVLSAWADKANANAAEMQGRSDSISKWMNKIPDDTRQFIVKNPGSLIGEPANVFAKGGKVVLKGLPLVGTSVTVVGAGFDVAMGEDLDKVAVSTVASTAGQIAGGWAGGALVGAVMGSEVPVAGTVVGAVIGGIIGGMAAEQVVESSWEDD